MSQLTVATLNLRNRMDRWLQRRHLVVAAFLDSAPDLISLQEISLSIGQGRWLRNQLNWRLSGSGRGPYRLAQKRRGLPAGFYEGVGVLTRLPVVAQDGLALGHGGRVALRVNVELPDRRTLDFVAIHLHHVARDRQIRHEQVMRLTGWLNDRSRAPLQIVAGDFNETPDGPAIRQMKQVYRSAYAERHGYEPLATCPTVLAPRPDDWCACLDYIFLSPAVGRVAAARIFGNRPAPEDDTLYPSDHVGLLAKVDIE